MNPPAMYTLGMARLLEMSAIDAHSLIHGNRNTYQMVELKNTYPHLYLRSNHYVLRANQFGNRYNSQHPH